MTIRATKRPFAIEEAHLVDADFYTELEEDVRVLTRRMEGAWVPSISERMGPLNEDGEGGRIEETYRAVPRPQNISKQLKEKMRPRTDPGEHEAQRQSVLSHFSGERIAEASRERKRKAVATATSRQCKKIVTEEGKVVYRL